MSYKLDKRIASALKMAQKTEPGFHAVDFGWNLITKETTSFHVLRYWGKPGDDADAITGALIEALITYDVHALWTGCAVDPIYVPVDVTSGEKLLQPPVSAAAVRRLTRLMSQAFVLLADEHNIVSPHDFMQCQDCACPHIPDTVPELAELAGAAGYVLYDENDINVLDELGWLYLSYGSCDDHSDTAELAIGHHVAAAFQEVGLRVAWNGKRDNLIRIHLPDTIQQ